MQIKQLTWTLNDSTTESAEMRHCSNCGRTVRFTDTMIRRHNANGKNIYRFAIYKCEKNHTWNKKLEIYRTYSGHARVVEEPDIATAKLSKIPVQEHMNEGINQVQISLARVEGKFRLDKILSEQIDEWSRTEIAERIGDGKILINDTKPKPSTKLKSEDIVTIHL